VDLDLIAIPLSGLVSSIVVKISATRSVTHENTVRFKGLGRRLPLRLVFFKRCMLSSQAFINKYSGGN
jgi:hypothetical protein